MGKSRFYTRTHNTKGNEVRTNNNAQFAQAILGVNPVLTEEEFHNEEVIVRMGKAKNGDIVLSILPKTLLGNLQIMGVFGKNAIQIGQFKPEEGTVFTRSQEDFENATK